MPASAVCHKRNNTQQQFNLPTITNLGYHVKLFIVSYRIVSYLLLTIHDGTNIRFVHGPPGGVMAQRVDRSSV